MTRKVFFWALEKLHGSFSYIGAQRKLQKPELFMPQLLIKKNYAPDTAHRNGTTKDDPPPHVPLNKQSNSL